MPAIVIAAHARPAALQRLLASVARADIPTGTSMVISVDVAASSGPFADKAVLSEQVLDLANAFDWEHGAKSVIVHEQIGLVEHFHRCGDLTAEHGSVVLLEDDLLVGPGFYRWATAALEFGECDHRVAGVGLVTPWFDGYRHMRFEPVDDGTDGIYMQVPWYDGMAWTARMWRDYRQAEIDESTRLHAAFDQLADDEWFPGYVRYLVQSGRTFLLPRAAQATGTGAAGEHFEAPTDWFQSELAVRAPNPLRLASIDDSLSVYDDHMEMTTEVLQRLVDGFDPGVVVDIRGCRNLEQYEADTMVLTIRPAAKASKTWGAAMHPLEMNLVHDEPGTVISLARVADVDTAGNGEQLTVDRLRTHHHRGREPHQTQPPTGLLSGIWYLRDRLRRAL